MPLDSLAPGVVQPLLRGRFGRDYRHAGRTASTQRLLDGAAEGAVAVAEEQTEGRGRLGRSWRARPGTSVLVSVVLEPPVPAARLPELTPVAGEACAEAIAAVTGLAPAIKPPNDVLVDGRKVAGILAEARDGRVTLGIGVNVNAGEEELPRETETPAGSLSLAAGREVSRAELLAELLFRLEERYDAWVAAAR
jgi:BirA family biotin operon repressor/biotin-[acetyl-CoA-carboxylase] ligase